MKKLLFICLFFTFSLSTMITTISTKNMDTLSSLNIENDFIKDKETNKLYSSYLKKKKDTF